MKKDATCDTLSRRSTVPSDNQLNPTVGVVTGLARARPAPVPPARQPCVRCSGTGSGEEHGTEGGPAEGDVARNEATDWEALRSKGRRHPFQSAPHPGRDGLNRPPHTSVRRKGHVPRAAAQVNRRPLPGWRAQLVMIQVKRAYDTPAPGDGCRVLVDRLWPRGLSKERAAVDEWLREVAPSTALRRWFAHDPARWAEFERRYSAELVAPAAREAVARLRSLAIEGHITLLYAAKDEFHNNAVALRDHLASSR